jgi:hypothetical protein
MLDRREELNGYSAVVDSLAVSVGLYPYADPSVLNIQQQLEVEAHRPPGLENTIFHSVQAAAYGAIMDGESVVLSAPTSFGKSLIIDALIASDKFENIAIIVPTIALIDETRRRLASQFSDHFKIITHPGQELSDRNVLVMTQERILDIESLPPLGLFIIDEFYKLDPGTSDADRANLLNQAFYRLKRTGAQFYLLGPNIRRMPVQLNELARVIFTDFSTVSLEVRRVDTSGVDDLTALVRLCSQLDQPTLIYCRSPAQARTVAAALIAALGETATPEMEAAIEWIGDNYHPDWSFAQALARGIGIHHGRIPRSLGQLAVRAFNSGVLKYLICTSTLIEGVNTKAKNVIIFDNKIGRDRYDFFTFNNIKGRSGRMFSHFVGHVYVFHDPPADELREIDVPVLTQPSATEPSLLIQMESEDLTDESKAALSGVLEQTDLSLEDLRKSSGVDPEMLVALARRLKQEPALRVSLTWTGLPRFEHLRALCTLIWEDLGGRRKGGAGTGYIRSGPQLAFRLNRLRDGIPSLIAQEIQESAGDADLAVENVLDFVRQWAGFNFPRLAMVVERVQNRIAGELSEPRSSYGFYVAQVESLFQPRSLVALEEYGLPIQIGAKIHATVDLDVSLDDALEKIRTLNIDSLSLTSFETEILEDTRDHL